MVPFIAIVYTMYASDMACCDLPNVSIALLLMLYSFYRNALRWRLGPFLTTMKTDYAAVLAFKTCLRGVGMGVGHVLRGMSIYSNPPIRCIESYLLPCCRDTCFPLAQARRTILHLWVGDI